MSNLTVNEPVGNHLANLAEAIKEAHELASMALRAGLHEAKRAGELLLAAKGQVKHGQWLNWLSSNCRIPERTAQAYMKIASRWEELEKSATVADLTFREASRLLAKPAPAADWLAEIDRKITELKEGIASAKFAEKTKIAQLDVEIEKIRLEACQILREQMQIFHSPGVTVEQLTRCIHALTIVGNVLAMDRLLCQSAIGEILNKAEEDGTSELLLAAVNRPEVEAALEEKARQLGVGPAEPDGEMLAIHARAVADWKDVKLKLSVA